MTTVFSTPHSLQQPHLWRQEEGEPEQPLVGSVSATSDPVWWVLVHLEKISVALDTCLVTVKRLKQTCLKSMDVSEVKLKECLWICIPSKFNNSCTLDCSPALLGNKIRSAMPHSSHRWRWWQTLSWTDDSVFSVHRKLNEYRAHVSFVVNAAAAWPSCKTSTGRTANVRAGEAANPRAWQPAHDRRRRYSMRPSPLMFKAQTCEFILTETTEQFRIGLINETPDPWIAPLMF